MVVHAYYPYGETRVQRQAEALVRHGYEVDVICLRNKKDAATEFHNGVRVVRVPVQYGNYSWMGWKFWEYLHFCLLAMLKLIQLHRRQPYGTVQTHNLPDFLVFAAWYPKLAGARVILDLHDLMPEFYQARYGSDSRSRLVRLVSWQEKISCRFAHHVITVSELWRQTLIKRGVPADKVSVVMNVADHTIFRSEVGRSTAPANNGCLRLIYHGTVTYRYGIDLILKAVAQVRQQIPVHVTIHGGGEYLPKVVALAKELNLTEENLSFSSKNIPLPELPRLIRSAHVGLAPYRTDVFTDGIVPTKLMEYAALGLPAIAARTSAIQAYFSDTMVEFFTPGDADDLARSILKLHQDRAYLAHLTCGAEQFNQRYNWEKLSDEYVALIERLRPSR
jgi:glycosyltransferase involved in cell wall biosynthesis